MPAVARTFCGERDRYGGRAKDLDHLATQLSDFIRTWLRCHPGYFPELRQVLNIEKVYSEDDGMNGSMPRRLCVSVDVCSTQRVAILVLVLETWLSTMSSAFLAVPLCPLL
jgi:hypothetical protein